jgi:hypothetical protein
VKNVILLVMGLVAGLLIAQLSRQFITDSSQAVIAVSDTGSSPADSAGRRIAELERELQALQSQNAGGGPEQGLVPLPVEQGNKEFETFAEERRAEKVKIDTANLLAAGFSQSRIEWIKRRADELKSQREQADFERRQNGLPPPDPYMFSAYMFDADLDLQDELGDAEYEKYRKALGRPTAVLITGVEERSNAANAGLRANDEIVMFDDERVFSVDQVRSLAAKVKPGTKLISVEVIRDGRLMRLSVPAGPLGIKMPSWSARLQGG